jgi:hypothetical protein
VKGKNLGNAGADASLRFFLPLVVGMTVLKRDSDFLPAP